jgi:exodeoxyribonuclease VII large subunit
MDLRLRFAEFRRRLETATTASVQSLHLRLSRKRAALMPLEAHLKQLSPTAILERGYAIVQDPSGHVIKTAAEVTEGASLQVRLSEGRLTVDVKEKR